jgi:hypothetical protein
VQRNTANGTSKCNLKVNWNRINYSQRQVSILRFSLIRKKKEALGKRKRKAKKGKFCGDD